MRRGLTAKQSGFVAEFLNNGGNATAAYRKAFNAKGATTVVSAMAYKLRHRPAIVAALAASEAASAAAVQSAVERYGVTAERVADEMARLAFTRLDQVCRVARVPGRDGKPVMALEVRPFDEIEGDALSALVKVRRSAGGEVTVELADKLAALNSLARLKGWIADKPAPPANLVMFKVER